MITISECLRQVSAATFTRQRACVIIIYAHPSNACIQLTDYPPIAVTFAVVKDLHFQDK